MAEERVMEYVPREVFNVHLQQLADRHEIERKIDAKLDRTKIELQGQINALDKKIDSVKAELTEKINGLDAKLTAKIDGVDAKLTGKIDNLDKRLDDIDKNQNKWFAIFGIALAFITVAIPFITIMAQKFLQ